MKSASIRIQWMRILAGSVTSLHTCLPTDEQYSFLAADGSLLLIVQDSWLSWPNCCLNITTSSNQRSYLLGSLYFFKFLYSSLMSSDVTCFILETQFFHQFVIWPITVQKFTGNLCLILPCHIKNIPPSPACLDIIVESLLCFTSL